MDKNFLIALWEFTRSVKEHRDIFTQKELKVRKT